MISLLKKIYRKIIKKNNPIKKVDVTTVLVIHNALHSESKFLKAFKTLDDDFKIEINDYQQLKEKSFQNVKEFHFVVIISDFNSELCLEFRKHSKKCLLSGLILLNELESSNQIKLANLFDVIWFTTFKYASLLKTKAKLIHGFAIDDEIPFDDNLHVSIEEKILYSRLNNASLESYKSSNHEFLKSPIWDMGYFKTQIQKGLNAFSKDDVRATNLLDSNKLLKAGKFSFYNKNLLITGDEHVCIGSFCSFGKDISIYTSNHDTNYASTQGFVYRKFFKTNHPGEQKINPSKSRTKGPVIIKNDVWIGDGVKIMSGVTIGNGACIAAGSVITSNVGDYEVFGGVPAKKIKIRFNNQQVIDFLLQTKWWLWSDAKIKRNQAFFNHDFNALSIDKLKGLIVN